MPGAVNLKAPLSGGTAAAGDLVLIGSSDGRLFALNAADGKTRWQARLNGEVLAAPAISEKLIAVRTGDGKLHGLSPADGHELWSQEQQVPRLSLRGTAAPDHRRRRGAVRVRQRQGARRERQRRLRCSGRRP